MWREPDHKNTSGWRGPAELVRLYAHDNKGIVMWRGYPLMIPLRHIRPHHGFVWWTTCVWWSGLAVAEPPIAGISSEMLTAIDGMPGSIVYTYGIVFRDKNSLRLQRILRTLLHIYGRLRNVLPRKFSSLRLSRVCSSARKSSELRQFLARRKACSCIGSVLTRVTTPPDSLFPIRL